MKDLNYSTGANAGSQLLTVSDIAGLLQITERTCWRLARQAEAGIGVFPRPLRIAPRTVRWRTSDVEAYIARLAAPGEKGTRN
jgi:predicted DNA-binding transcriptional regulator AlpA